MARVTLGSERFIALIAYMASRKQVRMKLSKELSELIEKGLFESPWSQSIISELYRSRESPARQREALKIDLNEPAGATDAAEEEGSSNEGKGKRKDLARREALKIDPIEPAVETGAVGDEESTNQRKRKGKNLALRSAVRKPVKIRRFSNDKGKGTGVVIEDPVILSDDSDTN